VIWLISNGLGKKRKEFVVFSIKTKKIKKKKKNTKNPNNHRMQNANLQIS